MTKIIVDMKELVQFQKDLADNAEEFDNITKRMASIIEDLRKGWQGYDSHNFITNASSYLNNLKQIRDTLSEESELVQRRSRTYNNRIDDFYAKIRGPEEDDRS